MFTTEERKRPEGEVIEVIERHKTDFVGVIDIQKNFLCFYSQSKCIRIFLFHKIGGRAGDVVLVHIEDWPSEPIVLWSGNKSIRKTRRTRY
jgi:ribonuclease R